MCDPATPSFPSIPSLEYGQRIERTRAAMLDAGLQGILVTSEHSFRYYTGYILQSPVQQARPRFFVLPLEGEPCAVVPRTNVIGMRRTTWVGDIRSWLAPCPEDEGVSLIADALCSLIPSNGALGMELGAESRLGMPVADFLRLRELVAPRRVVDAQQLLMRVRMVKSPFEVERIRRICQIVCDGFDALPKLLAAGDTEWSACRKLQVELIRCGAHRTPHIVGVSGRGGYDNPNTGPTERELNRGDILFIDTGSTYDNYWCDFDRHFAFGPPPDRVERVHEALYRATDAALGAVRPGARTCDVWRAMMTVLDTGGSPGGSVGRMGHGLGLLAPEPPSINEADQTVIEAGMVLTIEPSLSYTVSDGGEESPRVMVHEENIVVTEDGCELLTRRAPAEIPVVS